MNNLKLKESIDSSGDTNTFIPTGSIISKAIPYTSLSLYDTELKIQEYGWAPCDGRSISRITFSNLWDILRNGTSSSPYGNGDGSTTFNVPDLRTARKFILGNGYGELVNATSTHSHATSSINTASLSTNTVNQKHMHDFTTNNTSTLTDNHIHNRSSGGPANSGQNNQNIASTTGGNIAGSVVSGGHVHTSGISGLLDTGSALETTHNH